jgi:UDP-N-acetylmuramoyl-L-alanyl-D-glutamate--2,6-diaminopimelate ligase
MANAAKTGGRQVRTYGRAGDWIRLIDRQPRPTGQHLRLAIDGIMHQADLPLVGDFQAMNALAALGLVLATGADAEAALVALSHLAGVRGRLEPVGTTPGGAAVYVDYAHTPDALATVLQAVRPHVAEHEGGRLTVLFGAGGDRDPGKRPEMGAVAARLADRAIVTDDNPRTEAPATIRAAILAACPQAREIGDRAEAIETAITALSHGDILVIAGKGHETYQEVMGVRREFDDAAIARAALARLGGQTVEGA